MKEYAKLARSNPLRTYAKAHETTKGMTEEGVAALKKGDIVELVCETPGSPIRIGDLFEVVDVITKQCAPVKAAKPNLKNLPRDEEGNTIFPKVGAAYVSGESYPVAVVKSKGRTYYLDETTIVLKSKAATV